jgi:HSP20 family molecular chaperone IbpA
MKTQTKSTGKFLVLDSSDAISAENEEIQNRIRERAYEISQMRGHAGREMDDWLSAEADVISVPPMDLIEKDGSFQVRIPAPGVDPKEVNVMATPEQMLVKCELHHSHKDESGVLHICDFKPATLFRSFRFPQPVDLQALKIEFHDGMLQITAPMQGSTESAARASRKRPAARKPPASKGKRGAA